MKILFFGDIVGQVGRNAVKHNIKKLVEKYQIDFVIANGENATHGKGLIEKHYNELIDAGVDCITLGNHYLSKNRILDYIDDATALVRPYNITKKVGGSGSVVFEVNGQKIRVTNILGSAFMQEEVNAPYNSMKELLEYCKDEDAIHIVDFHAEATGEKMALAYLLDCEVSAVVGTHTHVQTNDAKILEGGTGFITDVGMCGAANGVLGFDRNTVISKTIFGSETRFDINKDDQEMVNAVVIDINEFTLKCREIFPITIFGEKRDV